MSKNKQVSFYTEEEVEVTCSVSPGYRGRGPSMEHAGGEPAEPPEVEDLCVRLYFQGDWIDITDLLTSTQTSFVHEQCFNRAKEDERE